MHLFICYILSCNISIFCCSLNPLVRVSAPQLPSSNHESKQDAEKAGHREVVLAGLSLICDNAKRVCCCWVAFGAAGCDAAETCCSHTAHDCSGKDAGRSENRVCTGDHDVARKCSRKGGGNENFHGRNDGVALTCTNADLDTHAVSGRVSGRERACET